MLGHRWGQRVFTGRSGASSQVHRCRRVDASSCFLLWLFPTSCSCFYLSLSAETLQLRCWSARRSGAKSVLLIYLWHGPIWPYSTTQFFFWDRSGPALTSPIFIIQTLAPPAGFLVSGQGHSSLLFTALDLFSYVAAVLSSFLSFSCSGSLSLDGQ